MHEQGVGRVHEKVPPACCTSGGQAAPVRKFHCGRQQVNPRNRGQRGDDWAAMGHVKVVKSSPYFSRFQTKVRRAAAQLPYAQLVF